MDNKGRNVFMACVGGYLMYTGYNLIVDVLNKEPENKTMFLIAGAVFAIIGLLTIAMNLKEYFKDFKKDVFETEESVEEDAEYIEAEEVEAKRNHVEIVDMSEAGEPEEGEAEDAEEFDEEEEVLTSEEAEEIEE